MPVGGHFISPAPGIPSELGPQTAGESLSVAPAALRVDAATNIGGTVNASASWTSSWFDTLGMAQVVTGNHDGDGQRIATVGRVTAAIATKVWRDLIGGPSVW